MNLPNGYYLQNGKYQLRHVVGQGGFGITYGGVWFTEVKGSLGTIKTEVPVCIKEYFFKDYCYRDVDTNAVNVHSETGKSLFDKFKEKLIKEATILSEVHHPNIVNVLEVFEENNTAYIAMEYISGCSLKYMLEKEGVLPENKVLKYVHQIGKALQFVHEKNILHLDIKPSNIIIGKDDKARLIDFGVSKRYDVEDHETSTTMLTLSKGFASVEQYDNEGTQNFSPCPDIYSLGATMYNLLTGKIPTESILRATRPFKKPTDINPEISSKTESVIIKAMQIIPTDRFQTISEMLESLDSPSVEEDSVRNNLIQQEFVDNDGDTTVLALNMSGKENNDGHGDTTVINDIPTPIILKKKKKAPLIVAIVCVFALAGSAIVYWTENKTNHPIGNLDDLSMNSSRDSLLQEDTTKANTINTITPSDRNNVVIQDDKNSSKKEERSNVLPNTDKNKEQLEKSKTSASEKVDQPSAEEIQAKYTALLSSGKKKMELSNFSGARADFEEAKSLNRTDEVIRILYQLEQKEEEKLTIDKKTQYEEKMSFGKYKIVRKKSTGKYGAIDANAEEKIPCRYEQIGNPGNGSRSFQRENGLWDIYNKDGVLVNSGLTDY